MSWVVTAVVTNVGLQIYSADQQRKLAHQQQDAVDKQIADDKRERVEAETSAQVAANAKVAESKRRRRTSSLLSGDSGGDPLGGATAAIGATGTSGSAYAARVGGGASGPTGTALGAGYAASTAPGAYSPGMSKRKPTI